MRLGLAIGLAGLAACASTPRTSAEQAPAAPPETAVDRAVADLATKRATVVSAGTLGTSMQGRPLHVLTVAKPAGATGRSPDGRPAILIVAGLDGRQTVGTDTALSIADRLADAVTAPPPAPPQAPPPAPPPEPPPAPPAPAEGQPAGEQPPPPPPPPPGPIVSPELLEKYTVYIVPQLNPDAAVWFADPGHPKTDLGWAMVPDDADHDGRVDEDGPRDLNGDGVVTTMRVKNPPPGWGLDADLMIDPGDPRVMRAPDRMKGERAEYAVVVEGGDEDGDGLIAEDPPGGVDFDKNFPYRWPEFQEGAGRTQLCVPETRALVEWMLAHPNIVAVVSFGMADNLVNAPAGGQMDGTGQVPTGVENDDKPYHDKIAEVFKEITKMTAAPSADTAGSFRGWAYANFGVFSFSTPVWVRPDQIKKDDKPEEKKEGEPAPAAPEAAPDPNLDPAAIQARMSEFMSATPQRQAELRAEFEKLPAETRATIMASFSGQQPEGGPRRGGRRGRGPGGGGPPGGPGGASKPAGDSDDAKWLKYSDDARAGAGFIAWQSFQHPELGAVEIGGFVPGFKLNPPPEELPRLADEESRFIGKLLEKLPSLSVQTPTVESLGGGVWRIAVKLENDGFLPTRSAIGVKARRLPPTIVRIDLPEQAVISGERAHRVPALPGSGGSDLTEWVVAATAGAQVKIKINSPEFGDQVVAVTLQEAAR